jgi:tRNA nucleotidyltransferase (CCA-adding enzyme)
LFELLTKKKLAPITIDSCTTEETIFIFIISKNSHSPASRWQKGPPITNKGQEAFLTKYLRDTRVLHGPRIHQGRWWVLLAKEAQTVKTIIQEAIEQETVPLPSHLALSAETPILDKKTLLERLAGKKEQLVFVYKLLQGKPNYYY